MSLGSAGGSVGDGGANGGQGTGGTAAGAPSAGAGTGGSAPPASGAAGGQAGAAPPASGAPNPSLGNSGAGASTTWRDGLPDDLKADPTLGKYSDIANLAKAHVELQKKFGQKGIFKPAKDASPDEVKAFREALGIPTDPTKYDMGQFEGVKVDPSIVQWAQKLGVEQGIEPAALKAIITDYMKIDAQNEAVRAKTAEDSVKAGLEGLKKEWGDGYDRNIQRANFAAEKLGGKAFIDRLVELKVHNDPVLLKAFSEAAKLYGEDRLREGGVGDGRQTPEELDSAISSVQQQMFALKPGDGRYPGLKQKYESLWRQKTGGR